MAKQPRGKDGKFGVIHGGKSEEIRRKYLDKRTHEGKIFAAVRDNLVADLGGEAVITQKQWILLDRVMEKLIVLHRIGEWSLEQERIVNANGELLPCLGTNYISYSRALREDLKELYADVRTGQPMSKEQWRQTVIRQD